MRGISAPGAGTFEFAAAWAVPAGGYLLLVPGDPDVFRSRLSVPADVPIAGPYSGRLGNEGDRIRLMRPVAGQGESAVYTAVDQLRYNDRAPWPRSADGDGPSLERIFASDYANDPANWDASSGRGTPGSKNSVSLEDSRGLQRPSDLNQDGNLNITDAVALLGHLFGGIALDPPCQGAADAGGNIELLDASGDGQLNITDAVHVLTYLFRSGPAPTLGRDCVRIAGCPDACVN